MTTLVAPPEWYGPSEDPEDEQFADVVEPATVETAGEYAAVLVGEGYDADGGRGADRLPTALRDALAVMRTRHVEAGSVRDVADMGTVDVTDGTTDVAAVQDAIRDFAARVHRTDAVPVFLGGGGSLTYPNVAPLVDRGSVGVVSFDAHLRCRQVRDAPTHRTAFRQLFEEGLDSLAVVGARHFETAPLYHEYLDEREGTVVTPDAVGGGPVDAVSDALDSLGDVDAVYASVDPDVLDVVAPGGLSPGDLFAMLDGLAADGRVAGLEVTGNRIPDDAGDRVADVGARAVAHFLAGVEGRR